jgi:hypothetical protein
MLFAVLFEDDPPHAESRKRLMAARTKLHSFAAPTGIQGCSAGQMKSGRIHLSRRALADQDESKEE